MAGAAVKLMDADEFLNWCLGQEERWELVEGVPIRMMTGASGMHDRVVVNIISTLNAQLRGSRCRPTTADIALRTRIRSLRRPDVTVTCDPPRDDVYEAREPRMVVEVLSPSNIGVGWERKLREYRRHKALDYILLVDSAAVDVVLYVRAGDTWDDLDAGRLSDVIDLSRIGCSLALADVYDGTDLPERPPEDLE